MSQSQTHAKSIIDRSKADPAWFLEHVLGVQYLTPQQLEVIASVARNRRTGVTAGNGLGKTWIAAHLALWFLFTHYQSKVVTTAPTWKQVKNLLWRELRTAYHSARFPLGGVLHQAELNLADDWFAVGFSTSEPSNFQGYHAPRVMVIFDEATGIRPEIWEAADGITVGSEDRFLAIGNPTDPTSEFKRRDDSGAWSMLRLNGEEHPNVIGSEIKVPGAVTKEWIADRLEDYGDRDSSLYRARVRGVWPDQGEDTLIPLSVVESAKNRWLELTENWVEPPTPCPVFSVGCDVARYGMDETVIVPIYDKGIVGKAVVRRGQDLMTTAGHLQLYKTERRGVDDSGLGGGVTDRLRELKVRCEPVIAGSSAVNDKEFVNLRAELWWALREALNAGDLALPADHKLEAELTAVKFSYDSRGRVRIESKDDIKKRLGRSPDRADALTIANWVRVRRGPNKTIRSW